MIAADVTRQICIGLDYAHTLRGSDGEPLEIVHQDISPTNIMLAFTGTVKILDFGIARAAEFAEEEAKKGLIKGKVSYLSPEQIFVRPFDARADIFALGVVFHEMLTGRRLFQSRNDITKMRELLAAPILPPSAIDAMIPRELDRIVMRSLEIDPKNRYQTASDMAADLERTLIAARYSSRELSKMLRDLYLAGDEPLVVVDAVDDKENLEQTIAITSTATLPPIEQTHTVRHKEETQTRMDGVLRAERSRLQWMRWRARIKVTIAALAIAVVVGAVAFAAKKFVAEPADAVDAVAAPDAGDDKPDAARGGAKPPKTPAPAPAKQVKKRPKKEKGKGHAVVGRRRRGRAGRRRDPAADAAVRRRAAAPLLEAVQRDVDLDQRRLELGELGLVLVDHVERCARRVVRIARACAPGRRCLFRASACPSEASRPPPSDRPALPAAPSPRRRPPSTSPSC